MRTARRPFCSPTRYGLLTGRYAWRTRLQEWVIAAYEPPLIDQSRPTLPSFLLGHGYHTACFGKWHLGWDWPGPQPNQMTEIRNGQRHLQWDFYQADIWWARTPRIRILLWNGSPESAAVYLHRK